VIGPFRLALKYIAYQRFKSLILIGCIFLTALLPIAIKLLLWQFNEKIMSRADSTPIVVGAEGSSLDLTLHALYFKTQPPDSVAFGDWKVLRENEHVTAVPIHAKFTARNYPIVGTSLEYFDFRKLRINAGSEFAVLGDCVLGSAVADELNLKPGDQLLSDRENILDLAGLYPLKLRVAGILAANRSADDHAVFVDLKTAWVIEGLGHGHQDLSTEPDEKKILSRDDDRIVASAAVLPYMEITDANLDSFHFHGDTDQFPITAIVAVADDVKWETILEGQYDVANSGLQFVRPSKVILELMEMIFRIKLFFDANAILIAFSTVLLMILVVLLSLKLRQREMQTMFKIGCSRGTIAMLQVWEMLLIFGMAMLLLVLAVWGLWFISGDLVQSLLIR
jgi:putative ABC transport system permease protein